MQNKKKLLNELNTMQDLKTMVESYQEIAAMRTRKVKNSVLQTRDFVAGLSELYSRVMATYREEYTGHRKKAQLLRQTNGKTVAVLVTSNTGLYGDIIKKTFDNFLANIRGNSHDLVVIGRVGKQLLDNTVPKRSFRFFEANDSGVDRATIEDILSYILAYTNITVHHGLFVSTLNQLPTITLVTGETIEAGATTASNKVHCIIEPTVEEVAKFFENQILSAIFEQTMFEASLSKFASRMVSLDFVDSNISQYLSKLNFAKLKVRHMAQNSAQMERILGYSLWNK